MTEQINGKIVSRETIPPRPFTVQLREQIELMVKKCGPKQALVFAVPVKTATSKYRKAWIKYCRKVLKTVPHIREQKQKDGSHLLWLWYDEDVK